MPQSLSNVLIHIVYSTKNRNDWIIPEIETELHAYIATICQSYKSPVLIIGGTQNHIHILCQLGRTITISKLLEKIKPGSSKWIKTKGNQFSSFYWQNGYGSFSADTSKIISLKKYIKEQKKHHEHITFKEEYLELLKENNIEYDERYVWD
jgi:putative transposase